MISSAAANVEDSSGEAQSIPEDFNRSAEITLLATGLCLLRKLIVVVVVLLNSHCELIIHKLENPQKLGLSRYYAAQLLTLFISQSYRHVAIMP